MMWYYIDSPDGSSGSIGIIGMSDGWQMDGASVQAQLGEKTSNVALIVILVIVGVVVLGGGSFFGIRIYKKRQQQNNGGGLHRPLQSA